MTLSDSSGFEFAHTPINEDGELCTCGNTGCLETFISNEALIRFYNDLYANHKDTLPPGEGTGSIHSFRAEQVNDMVQLHWEHNGSDIWYFNVYSSLNSDFEITNDTLIGSTASNSYLYRSVKPGETAILSGGCRGPSGTADTLFDEDIIHPP